mmetsp:Transcript_106149/g.288040  ORF Transcript_106149/g.288040 Transcript_106149/m.288040 type:complete len:571 (+) Transcript_106149:167-1879(+)
MDGRGGRAGGEGRGGGGAGSRAQKGPSARRCGARRRAPGGPEEVVQALLRGGALDPRLLQPPHQGGHLQEVALVQRKPPAPDEVLRAGVLGPGLPRALEGAQPLVELVLPGLLELGDGALRLGDRGLGALGKALHPRAPLGQREARAPPQPGQLLDQLLRDAPRLGRAPLPVLPVQPHLQVLAQGLLLPSEPHLDLVEPPPQRRPLLILGLAPEQLLAAPLHHLLRLAHGGRERLHGLGVGLRVSGLAQELPRGRLPAPSVADPLHDAVQALGGAPPRGLLQRLQLAQGGFVPALALLDGPLEGPPHPEDLVAAPLGLRHELLAAGQQLPQRRADVRARQRGLALQVDARGPLLLELRDLPRLQALQALARGPAAPQEGLALRLLHLASHLGALGLEGPDALAEPHDLGHGLADARAEQRVRLVHPPEDLGHDGLRGLCTMAQRPHRLHRQRGSDLADVAPVRGSELLQHPHHGQDLGAGVLQGGPHAGQSPDAPPTGQVRGLGESLPRGRDVLDGLCAHISPPALLNFLYQVPRSKRQDGPQECVKPALHKHLRLAKREQRPSLRLGPE